MKRRVLIAVQDETIGEHLQSTVESLIGRRNLSVIKVVYSYQDAVLAFRDTAYDLLITELKIPEDANTFSDSENGVDLVQEITGQRGDVATIVTVREGVISVTAAEKLIPTCPVVVFGDEDFDDKLAKRIDEVLDDEREATAADKYIDIEFIIEKELQKVVQRGDSAKYVGTVSTYTLPEDLFVKWSKKSARLYELGDAEQYENWFDDFTELGEDLLDAFRDRGSHHGFDSIWAQIGAPNDINPNVRFRFVVDLDHYPIALEAIKHRAAKKFFILQAPALRKLAHVPAYSYPLFHNGMVPNEPLNCLIIESNAAGYCDGVRLREIGDVRGECDRLEKQLKGYGKKTNRFDVGEVEILRTGENESGDDFAARTKAALENGRWHIVHYAGHSSVEKDKSVDEGKGYLYFAGDRIKKVGVKQFAPWLQSAGAQFVYLSSCESAMHSVMYELAHHKVPAVIGFRWPVNSICAVQFADRFYDALLHRNGTPPCLEVAFRAARRDMFEAQEQGEHDRTWASPILLVQERDGSW